MTKVETIGHIVGLPVFSWTSSDMTVIFTPCLKNLLISMLPFKPAVIASMLLKYDHLITLPCVIHYKCVIVLRFVTFWT